MHTGSAIVSHGEILAQTWHPAAPESEAVLVAKAPGNEES